MYRTLLLLSKLRFYGGLRKLKRTLSTPKGILLALFTLAFFGMMLLPSFFVPRLPKDASARPNFNLFLHPVTLFGMWIVTSLGGRMKSPLAFTLPEVEFLFSGPFPRRRLLVYKLLLGVLGSLGFAVLMPLFAWNYLDVWWPAAFIGFWWTVAFIQMTTILTTLVFDWFGERFPRWRVLGAAVVVVLLAEAFWQAGVFASGLDIAERLAAAESSWLVQVVLSPFVVFNRLIVATGAGEFALRGSLALAINLVAIACILQMDARFTEASLAASQRRYDWLQRVKRGGGVPAVGTRSQPRFSLPRFPRALGAGPIAWRQLLHLVRGSGRLIFVVPVLIGPMIALALAGRQPQQQPPALAVFMPMFLAWLIGFFVTTILPLGLRIDLQHVDTIKALPIRAGAIVWGSIASAIGYTTFVQLLVVGGLAAGAGQWTWGSTLALVFAVPLNLLLIASDGVLVILFPSIRQFVPGDPLVGMRMMLVSVARMLFVVLMVAIAAFYVFVVYALLGRVDWALALAAWLALAIEGCVAMWFAGLLFERYDPSSHAVEEE